jgi:protein-S-isoprenylcysteine O-methyltransferase Ste14
MPLIDEFQHVGKWFFRWRSFLPLIAIVLFLIALEGYTYPLNSDSLDNIWEIFCLAVSFGGLAIRIYTVGHTPKGTSGRNTSCQRAEALNTTGSYSVVRHPLYLGNFFIWLGISLFMHSLFFSFTVTLLFLLYYERIIFVEEDFLRQKFGRQFDEWAMRTPLIFPRFKNWQKPSLPFSLKTVLKREYSALFLITTSFTCMEVLGDFFYMGKWQIGRPYDELFIIGLCKYILLRTMKKGKLLNLEGR